MEKKNKEDHTEQKEDKHQDRREAEDIKRQIDKACGDASEEMGAPEGVTIS